MDFKKFFQIVLLTVSGFCILIAISLGGLYMVNPEFLNDKTFLGGILHPLKVQKPINVLMFGTDKVGANTDVVLVANINPQTKKITVLSIPRDTRVEHLGSHKINSMYSRGKEPLLIEKASEIIGQPIDYYATVNPKTFRNIIDILGGVTVDVPRNMNYDDNAQNLHIHLKKGVQFLDGAKAEQFVRYRYGYANGDLGRIDAQQIFFKAFAEQKLKPEYILLADKLLAQIFENVKTDMPIDVAVRYSLFVKDLTTADISFLKLPGDSKTVHGASYFIYDQSETEKQIKPNFSLDILSDEELRALQDAKLQETAGQDELSSDSENSNNTQ